MTSAPPSAVGVRGALLILSGPSGVGKDTVVRCLQQIDASVHCGISYTTRPPRPGERDGVDYFFVGMQTFAAMQAADAFLESAIFHGHWYGTSADQVEQARAAGQTLVLIVDVQGARQLRARHLEAVFVFLAPPTLGALEKRLRGRGTEDETTLVSRLQTASGEIAESVWYDHVVVNDDVRVAAASIGALLAAQKQRCRERSLGLQVS